MDTPPAPAPSGGPLRETPLLARHRAMGARTAAFGRWEMPIEYAGGGVLREHRAVGVFDVSHLGKVVVRGAGRAHVDACLTNDLGRIAPGHAQYTFCCDSTGGVVDDLLAYLAGPDEVLLVPNPATARRSAVG